jgi:hypothetical protein
MLASPSSSVRVGERESDVRAAAILVGEARLDLMIRSFGVCTPDDHLRAERGGRD